MSSGSLSDFPFMQFWSANHPHVEAAQFPKFTTASELSFYGMVCNYTHVPNKISHLTESY